MRELTKNQVEALREQYPVGSRIRLIRMNDPYHPVPPGTKGTLVAIDDMGTFHVNWDNGRGLGLVPGRVQRLPAQALDGAPQPVPNIGWCALQPAGGRKDFSGTPLAGIGPGAQCYFVHSYEAKPAQAACRLADISYGGRPVCAAVQSGRVLGCQFHPEKSARAGLAVLQGFLRMAQQAGGATG